MPLTCHMQPRHSWTALAGVIVDPIALNISPRLIQAEATGINISPVGISIGPLLIGVTPSGTNVGLTNVAVRISPYECHWPAAPKGRAGSSYVLWLSSRFAC